MIQPQHYKYFPRSSPAKRERTILTTSGKKNRLKEFTLQVLHAKYLKSDPDESLHITPQYMMLLLST